MSSGEMTDAWEACRTGSFGTGSTACSTAGSSSCRPWSTRVVVGFPVVADILIEVAPWKLAETCARLLDMEIVASASASHAGRQLSIQVNARDEAELASFVKTTLPQLDGFVSAHCRDRAAAGQGPGLLEPARPGRRWGGRRVRRRRAVGASRPQTCGAGGRALSTIWTGRSSSSPRRTRACRPATWLVVSETSRTGSCATGSGAFLIAGSFSCRRGSTRTKSAIRWSPTVSSRSCRGSSPTSARSLAAMERVCYISAAPVDRGGRQLSIETNCRNEDELADFVQTSCLGSTASSARRPWSCRAWSRTSPPGASRGSS